MKTPTSFLRKNGIYYQKKDVMFENISYYAGDPILSLMESFLKDERKEKVNLSIGLYYDSDGKIPFLNSVQQAKNKLEKEAIKPSLYLPMSGAPSYCEEVRSLLFGRNSQKVSDGHIATIQTLGGSGALKIGGDFLSRWFPQATVWVSNPTWENHIAIFEGAGLPVKQYPYFDENNGTVAFQAMLTCLESLPANDIILLHPCCHNPTGADLTEEQWDQLIPILQQKQLIPFLDMAYQGLGDGFVEDTYAIQAMTNAGLSFFLSNSFSKIFSLYGERVGGLSVVCQTTDEAERVLGQLKATVRRNYSSPPTYGAAIVSYVLKNQDLQAIWLSALAEMRTRIESMRQKLYNLLLEKGGNPTRYQFLLQQKGMFSYSGYTPKQVETLRNEHGIYIINSGRICIAGINSNNIQLVANAMLALEKPTTNL